ncbi:peptidase inhibitor family I36 protein [Amycolatopsis sp. NPDC059657]|uniref:peptidase inhibitor family I36 protein n=1 Tax=Amycolatopsis sp. NPDC059657 TaxID=3346899 RepID=UPI003671B7F4
METCGEAQVCFYVDKNFQGFRTRFWDDQNQLNRKLDFRANSESRTVSSIKNLTPYYFRMWNSKGQNRCIAPSFQSANLGRWEDDVKYIGFYTKC